MITDGIQYIYRPLKPTEATKVKWYIPIHLLNIIDSHLQVCQISAIHLDYMYENGCWKVPYKILQLGVEHL